MDAPPNIVTILVSLLGGTLVILLGFISWFSGKIVDKVDSTNDKIDSTHALFVSEIHKHDLRLAELEGWKRGMDRRSNDARTDRMNHEHE